MTWNRVVFIERTCDVIYRYGTQSVMKVGLDQPIMREVIEKLMGPTDSDTEDSADEYLITKRIPVKEPRKG